MMPGHRHREIVRPDLIPVGALPMLPPCNWCAWVLVQRTDTRRIFRCSRCGRFTETLIYWKHEIQWKARPPLPADPADQMTIYDVLNNPVPLDLDALTDDVDEPRFIQGCYQGAPRLALDR